MSDRLGLQLLFDPTIPVRQPRSMSIDEDVLKIPKIGEVKAKLHRTLEGKWKTVTISMGKTGKYYASFLFDDGLPELEISSEGKAVGIEVGLTHFAIGLVPNFRKSTIEM